MLCVTGVWLSETTLRSRSAANAFSSDFVKGVGVTVHPATAINEMHAIPKRTARVFDARFSASDEQIAPKLLMFFILSPNSL